MKYSVIRFFNARNVKPADIHRQICEVYGENVMRDEMLRKWVRKVNEGRDNMHDEPRSGRPPGRLLSQAATFYEEGLQKL